MVETHETSVVWLQASSCSGCSVSVLNASASWIPEENPGRHLLVIEGSIPTADGGGCGTLGERPMVDRVVPLAKGVHAIIALGTCAAFGGMFAAAPNPGGCVGALLADRGIEVPLINVSPPPSTSDRAGLDRRRDPCRNRRPSRRSAAESSGTTRMRTR